MAYALLRIREKPQRNKIEFLRRWKTTSCIAWYNFFSICNKDQKKSRKENVWLTFPVEFSLEHVVNDVWCVQVVGGFLILQPTDIDLAHLATLWWPCDTDACRLPTNSKCIWSDWKIIMKVVGKSSKSKTEAHSDQQMMYIEILIDHMLHLILNHYQNN